MKSAYLYHYQCTVTKVYDGDTITVVIDLGFGVMMSGQVVRLYGINAPEMRGEEKARGTLARDFLREQILHQIVTVKTHKDSKGKYGRYLGEIYIGGENINKLMVTQGHAVKANY